MTPRSLLARAAIGMLAILVALPILGAGLAYVERRGVTESEYRLPLPDQIAAMVKLLDHAIPEDRRDLLRALNGAGVIVDVRDDIPPPWPDERPIPGIVRSIRRYVDRDDGPQERFIGAWLGTNTRLFRPAALLRNAADNRVRVLVALQDGQYLQVEVVGDLVTRIFGLPSGFFAGVSGFLVAALALFIFAREMRPLTRLARKVATLGGGGGIAVFPEEGAREVRVLIRAINQAYGRITTLLNSRTFMLAALSHDLRTYLTRMRLRVEMIPDLSARDQASRDVEEMQALVEDSLVFTRAVFTAQDHETVDLADIVRAEYQARLTAAQPIAAVLPAGPVLVRASPLALRRAIANVIDNALKYGGQADITLTVSGTMANVRVADRGPGIPMAAREKVFEPFERLEASRNRRQGGAGLGLAIVREIVDGLGGTVTIDDRPEGGAVVSLNLPVVTPG